MSPPKNAGGVVALATLRTGKDVEAAMRRCLLPLSVPRKPGDEIPEPVWDGRPIASITRKVTKKGDAWAAATLEDLGGAIEVLFFPNSYQLYATAIADDAIVIIKGKVDRRDDVPKLIAMDMNIPDLTTGTDGGALSNATHLAAEPRADQGTAGAGDSYGLGVIALPAFRLNFAFRPFQFLVAAPVERVDPWVYPRPGDRITSPLFRMRGLHAAPVGKGNFGAFLAERLLDLDPVAVGQAFHLLLGAHHRRIFAGDLENVVALP